MSFIHESPFSPLFDPLWSASALQWCPEHWADDWIATPKLNSSAWDSFCEYTLSDHLSTGKVEFSGWFCRAMGSGQEKDKQVTFYLDKKKKKTLIWHYLCDLLGRRCFFFYIEDLFFSHAARVRILWNAHISVSDRTGRGKEKGEKRRTGREQCEPIYTSREEPERCWGHAELSTVSLTRRHVKHAHLTFNQYMKIPGFRWGMWKAWNNECT